jgi:hypothetical protein
VSGHPGGTEAVPSFSVVIPLYNKARYVRRALGSVLGQTETAFEVVVVDDGSTDRGHEVVAGIGDPRVKIVRQPNAGVSAARNRGIRETVGRMIAFLDADDEWGPDFLSCITQASKSFPEAGLYATGYRCLFNRGLIKEVTASDGRPEAPVIVPRYFRETRRVAIVTSSSAAVPRGVLEVVGGFPEGEPYGEDRDLWGRIAIRYPVVFHPRVAATYHCEAEGRSMLRGRGSPIPPPFIRTAEKTIREGTLSSEKVGELKEYADWLRVLHAERLVAARKRLEAMRVIDELLSNGSPPARARVLGTALKHLPIGLVDSLLRVSHSRLLRFTPSHTSGCVDVRFSKSPR